MKHRSQYGMVTCTQPESHSTAYLLTELQRIADVRIVAEQLPDGYVAQHADLHETWKRGGSFVRKIFRQVQKLKLKVVHVQHEFNLYGGIRGVIGFPFLLLLLRLAGVKTLVSIHGMFGRDTIDDRWCRTFGLRTFPNSLAVYRVAFGTFYRSVALLANAIHVNSHAAKRDIVSSYGAKPSKVHVIPLGVPEPISDAPSSGAAWESRINGDMLLAFGYILPRKGLEVLLDAFEDVKRNVPTAQLCIAGEDLPTHKTYANDLRAEIARRFSGEDVIVTGPVSHTEMLWLFNNCAAAVFPYTVPAGSSGPLTLALQFGCPVIATDFEVFSEVMAGYGRLVTPGDARSLAAACIEVLSDRELRRSFSAAAQIAAQDMSWRNVAAKMLKIYEQLGESNNGRQTAEIDCKNLRKEDLINE